MNWRPISEPITLPPDGTPLYWIEDGDRYRIIQPPPDMPWPAEECFCAKFTGSNNIQHSSIRTAWWRSTYDAR